MLQRIMVMAGAVEDASDPGLLPIIAAIAIGLPMAGVLVFFLWVKIRDRGDPAGPVLRPSVRELDDEGADDSEGAVAEGPVPKRLTSRARIGEA